MLRIGNISEVLQTRTLRVNYGNTQAYPFAASIDASVYDATGTKGAAFNKSAAGGTALGSAGQGPIWPGMVAAFARNGQTVCVAVGATSNQGTAGLLPLGLFGNFVGGDFDEVGDYTEVGVWKGPGSFYEVLYPVYNANISSTQYSSNGPANPGTNRQLYWDGNGLLSSTNPGSGSGSASLFSPIALLAGVTGSGQGGKIQIELLI
jgi:hypothetical protein